MEENRHVAVIILYKSSKISVIAALVKEFVHPVEITVVQLNLKVYLIRVDWRKPAILWPLHLQIYPLPNLKSKALNQINLIEHLISIQPRIHRLISAKLLLIVGHRNGRRVGVLHPEFERLAHEFINWDPFGCLHLVHSLELGVDQLLVYCNYEEFDGLCLHCLDGNVLISSDVLGYIHIDFFFDLSDGASDIVFVLVGFAFGEIQLLNNIIPCLEIHIEQ